MVKQLVIMQRVQELSLKLGIWPDPSVKKSILKRIGVFILNCVMLYGIIGGCYLLYVKNNDHVTVLRNFLYFIRITLSVVKYFTVYLNHTNFGRVLRKIQNLWNDHFDETAETSNVFRQTEKKCNNMFWFFTFLHVFAVVTHLTMIFWKVIKFSNLLEASQISNDYDIIFPIQYIFICNSQTCIDYYVPHILTLLYGIVCAVLMMIHDSFYASVLIQGHGQLKMLKRQIEIYNLKYNYEFRMTTKQMEKCEYQHLCKIVKLHSKTIDLLISIDDVTQMENIVHFISFTAILCLETILLSENIRDLKIYTLTATTLLQLYLISNYGQNIINELDSFENVLYFDTKWYTKNLQIQKLIQMMHLRSSNVRGLTIARTKIISFAYFINMGQFAYYLFTLINSLG